MARIKKEKKRKHNIIIVLCVAVFILNAVYSLVSSQIEINSKRKQLDEVIASYDEQIAKNKELTRLSELAGSDEYYERIAREKLDFGYPLERVYIYSSGVK